MPYRALICAALASCLLAVPAAHAVVGGRQVAPASAPWFVGTGVCGGTLIAPDRIATAAHCFDPVDYADLERVQVGDEVRRGTRVALPPTWRQRSAGFAVDDIAIVQLDRPVTSVRPASLSAPGARLPARLRILGRGQITAPPPGREAPSGLFPLRQATLRSLSDTACATRWRRSRTKYRHRFSAAREVCALDADGRRPLDSVCAGDSGGPLIAGTLRRPVLVGVIAWTGPRCGADRLPTVAMEVDRYRTFLTDPDPRWAPVPGGSPRIAGDARVGGALTCEPPAWEVAPERVDIRWLRRVRGADGAFRLRELSRGATYTAQAADAGLLLECQVLGSGSGGSVQVPPGPASVVRIAG